MKKVLSILISLFAIAGCYAQSDMTEEKRDSIVTERARPLFEQKKAEYKAIQSQWNDSKSIGTSAQLGVLEKNESWFTELGISVETIEDGVNFFDVREDAVMRVMLLKSKSKAALQLADEERDRLTILRKQIKELQEEIDNN